MLSCANARPRANEPIRLLQMNLTSVTLSGKAKPERLNCTVACDKVCICFAKWTDLFGVPLKKYH